MSTRGAARTAILVRQNFGLYLFMVPALAYFVVFHYGPMYGVQIAFKDFRVTQGIAGSPWAGFAHFVRFLNSYQFWTVLRNTLALSVSALVCGFPMPIILALLLNQLPSPGYKRFIQTVSYAPHFVSTVVLASMVFLFLSPRTGLVNHGIRFLGLEPVFFMARPGWFRPVYIISGIWQHIGWSSIVYLAALTSIDPELHEAAIVDGATKLQRIRHIDIPGIAQTVVVIFVLNVGQVMGVGFEKAYLLQTPLNIDASEIIATYVYKTGLLNAQFSYSAAVGLFNAVVNLILLVSVNRLVRSLGQKALW